jgi:hypothetical protein
MLTRSFMHESQYRRHWLDLSVGELCAALGLSAHPPANN